MEVKVKSPPPFGPVNDFINLTPIHKIPDIHTPSVVTPLSLELLEKVV